MTLHPKFQITPAQHATVNALRARLTAAIDGAPQAWMTARATKLLAKLDANIAENSKVGLSIFLGDGQEGIESECRTLENAAKRECRVERRLAA